MNPFPVSSLSETQHSASAPCQRAVCQCVCEGQITLWWRVPVVIVVCTLHLPSNTYEDLLKTRAEQRESALTWQATMATGKGAGRTEAGGRHSRGRWELLWPACGGHNAQVELTTITWLLRTNNHERLSLAVLLPNKGRAGLTDESPKKRWKKERNILEIVKKA